MDVTFAFFGHDELADFVLELVFVFSTAKAFVEADAGYAVFTVASLESLDGGEGGGVFVGAIKDLVVEDEVVLVGGDEEFSAQFYGLAGFAFGDPLAVGFEEGEDFFAVGDGLVFEDATLDEVDVFF